MEWGSFARCRRFAPAKRARLAPDSRRIKRKLACASFKICLQASVFQQRRELPVLVTHFHLIEPWMVSLMQKHAVAARASACYSMHAKPFPLERLQELCQADLHTRHVLASSISMRTRLCWRIACLDFSHIAGLCTVVKPEAASLRPSALTSARLGRAQARLEDSCKQAIVCLTKPLIPNMSVCINHITRSTKSLQRPPCCVSKGNLALSIDGRSWLETYLPVLFRTLENTVPSLLEVDLVRGIALQDGHLQRPKTAFAYLNLDFVREILLRQGDFWLEEKCLAPQGYTAPSSGFGEQSIP